MCHRWLDTEHVKLQVLTNTSPSALSSQQDLFHLSWRTFSFQYVFSRVNNVAHSQYSSKLFYSLLSLAYQVDFNHKYGASGFVIFWMVNWTGMLAGYVCSL